MDITLDRAFFQSRLHQSFQCEGSVEIQLVECNFLPSQAGTRREPFSLIFRGPAATFLPQKTYELKNGATEPVGIFLVPVGRDSEGFLYEAVFN
jgi:hypothetical protein